MIPCPLCQIPLPFDAAEATRRLSTCDFCGARCCHRCSIETRGVLKCKDCYARYHAKKESEIYFQEKALAPIAAFFLLLLLPFASAGSMDFFTPTGDQIGFLVNADWANACTNFTASADYTAHNISVRFGRDNGNGATNSAIAISLWTQSGGVPGTLLDISTAQRVDSYTDTGGAACGGTFETRNYTLQKGVNLTSGTAYWICGNATGGGAENDRTDWCANTNIGSRPGFDIVRGSAHPLSDHVYTNAGLWFITYNDTPTPPPPAPAVYLYYSKNATNATNTSYKTGTIWFSATFNTTALSLAKARFEWNGTNGSFTNDTPLNLNTAVDSVNITKVVQVPPNSQVHWRIYFNDSDGKMNFTEGHFSLRSTAPSLTLINPHDGDRNASTSFLANASDIDGHNITFYWYVNGTLNATGGNVSNFTASDGTYKLDVIAGDGIENSSNTSVTFTLDTAAPVIAGASDATHTAGTILNFTINITDNHLFSWNLSCSNGFNSTGAGLDITLSSLNVSFNLTANVACSIAACDGHTANDAKASIIQPNASTIKIRFSALRENVLSSDNAEISAYQEKDRVRFDALIPGKAKGVSNTLVFYYTTSEEAVYLPSEEYHGWIVDGAAGTWFDANSQDKEAAVEVFQIKPGLWEIRVTSSADIVHFESIGTLNCVSQNFYLTALPPPSVPFFAVGECPASSDALKLLAITALILLLYLAAVRWVKVPIISVIATAPFYPLALSLLGCSKALGVAALLISFALSLREIFS